MTGPAPVRGNPTTTRGAYLWQGGDVAPLQHAPDLSAEICSAARAPGGVLLTAGEYCFEDPWSTQVWLVDPDTGDTRLVAPPGDRDLRPGPGPALAPAWR